MEIVCTAPIRSDSSPVEAPTELRTCNSECQVPGTNSSGYHTGATFPPIGSMIPQHLGKERVTDELQSRWRMYRVWSRDQASFFDPGMLLVLGMQPSAWMGVLLQAGINDGRSCRARIRRHARVLWRLAARGRCCCDKSVLPSLGCVRWTEKGSSRTLMMMVF